MGWLSVVGDALGSLFKVAGEPIKEWQKRKTLKVEQEDKELEREHELGLKKLDIAFKLAEQGQKVEADWDRTAQKQMENTYKDEYLLLLFSVPLIGAFIPEYQETVLQGFEVLSKTPEWYMMSILGMVAATYGLRWLLGKVKR